MTIVAVAAVAAAAACTGSPSQRPVKAGPVNTTAGSLEATRRDLAGQWTLGHLELIRPQGVRDIVQAHGTLTYDAFGNLNINGTIDDPRMTTAIVLNYTGRITIDPVKHEFYPADMESARPVDESRIAPIAPDKVRRYELAGDRFTITYLDASGNPTAVSVWSRGSR
jgi:hypothetical protein